MDMEDHATSKKHTEDLVNQLRSEKQELLAQLTKALNDSQVPLTAQCVVASLSCAWMSHSPLPRLLRLRARTRPTALWNNN